MTWRRFHAGALVFALSTLGPALADYLPGGSFLKMSTPGATGIPHGVSADGTYLVGNGGYTGLPSGNTEAFRWTRDGLYEWLGDLPGGIIASYANGVSSDGNVVAGSGRYGPDSLDVEATRWTASTGMVGLGFLPGHDFSSASGVSADGSIIVGSSHSTVGEADQRGFRWTEAGGMQDLGFESVAWGITPDGGTIFGHYNYTAARWTQANGWQSIGDLPGGNENGNAYGGSADGLSVIVGMSSSTVGTVGEAFRWTPAGGMQGLGFLGDLYGTYISSATGVSGDGTIIVGLSTGGPAGETAFIWDEAHGMRSLKDVLINDYGVTNIQSDYYLTEALAISTDGQTIVGMGYRNGNYSGWVATIPEPSTLSLLVMGALLGARRRRP
jgi:probable HAF family extracellular repeat protein